MKTRLIESFTKDSDYYYDQKKHTKGCGDMLSITIAFQYQRKVELDFKHYPELISITEQLLKYVEEVEPVKQRQIKQKILEVLKDVK